MTWLLIITFKDNTMPVPSVTILMDDLTDISWYVNTYPDEDIEKIEVVRPT